MFALDSHRNMCYSKRKLCKVRLTAQEEGRMFERPTANR